MIKKLFLIALISFFFLQMQAQDTIYTTIYPGKGLGTLTLKESTKADVIALYGKKFKEDKKVFSEYDAKQKTYITKTYFKMIYKKKGLVFFFVQTEGDAAEVLTEIEISSPFFGKTTKGIILGQSTFADLISFSGNKAWTYSKKNKRVSKIYDGILYSSTVKDKIPPFNAKVFNELYNQNTIDFIKISAL